MCIDPFYLLPQTDPSGCVCLHSVCDWLSVSYNFNFSELRAHDVAEVIAPHRFVLSPAE